MLWPDRHQNARTSVSAARNCRDWRADHSNLTMCLQCFPTFLGGFWAQKALDYHQWRCLWICFMYFARAKWALVVINHFLASLPATWLVAKVGKSLLRCLLFFFFGVRICPNTVAFAALLEDNSEPLLKQTLNCSATSGKCSCSKLWDFVRLLPGDWLLLLGNFVWGWQVFRDFMASYRLCHNSMRKLHFSLVMLRKRCVCMLEGVFRRKKPPRGCWCSVSGVFRGSYLFSFM